MHLKNVKIKYNHSQFFIFNHFSFKGLHDTETTEGVNGILFALAGLTASTMVFFADLKNYFKEENCLDLQHG
jgi:hypothetical protein